MKRMSTVVLMRFSVLDRAAGTSHETPEETLQGVAAHAQHVEQLGFSRFLVAEHHGYLAFQVRSLHSLLPTLQHIPAPFAWALVALWCPITRRILSLSKLGCCSHCFQVVSISDWAHRSALPSRYARHCAKVIRTN